MAGDWIKLHRRLLDNPIMRHAGLSQLWLYCLLRANWKATQWLIPRTTIAIEIPAGSFITGRQALHEALYPAGDKRELCAPASATLWRWLLALESMGCIKTRNVSNRCTMVSIVKYSEYQSNSRAICSADEQQVSSSRAAGEQQVSTVEEREDKDKEEEEVKTPPNPRDDYDLRFGSFWNAYPKKIGKAAAVKAWNKLTPSDELQAVILAAVEAQKQSSQWTKDGGQFIPHASTWLNGRRWEDQLNTNGSASNDRTRFRYDPERDSEK